MLGKSRFSKHILFILCIIIGLCMSNQNMFRDILATGSRKLIDFFECPQSEVIIFIFDVLSDGKGTSSVSVSGDIPIGCLLESVHEAVFYAFWDEVDVFGSLSSLGIHLLFFDESRGHRFTDERGVASSAVRVAVGDAFGFY